MTSLGVLIKKSYEMKNLLSIFCLSVLMIGFLSACSDDGGAEINKLDLMTSKTWTVTDVDITVAGLPTSLLPDSLQEIAATLDLTGSTFTFSADNSFVLTLPNESPINGTYTCSADEKSFTMSLDTPIEYIGNTITFEIEDLDATEFEISTENTVTINGVGDVPYTIELQMG